VGTILIVCHANTARSVMAHVLLERMLADRGVGDGIRIRSGGIANYARDGMLPSLDARIVLRDEGIDLDETGLTSTDLKRHRSLLAEADLILTMTAAQKAMLAAFAEAQGRPVFTLPEFAGLDGDIEDPAMQGEEAFRACFAEIKRSLAASVDRLIASFAPSPRAT
jgi:protein-tyrosine-phosphatase